MQISRRGCGQWKRGTREIGQGAPVPARRTRYHLTGPATRATARAAGVTGSQLRHRDVVRLSRDTYLPRAVAGVLSARVEAVLLTAPDRAVISHATAAGLWGVAIPLQREDPRVHLTVATGSAVRGRRDRVVHRTPLDDSDVTTRNGVPVTTPERTWRDLATVLNRLRSSPSPISCWPAGVAVRISGRN